MNFINLLLGFFVGFDEHFIEKVLSANNVVEIISQFSVLKGGGNRYSGLCPFPNHNEKTPSFSVSEDRQLYHCFGCKKSGNAYNFLIDYFGMNFPEAVEHLANRASIPLPVNEQVRSKKEGFSKTDFYKLTKIVAEFYHKNLFSLDRSHEIFNYIKSRDLDQVQAKEFKLGIAVDSWDGLYKSIESNKDFVIMAERLGLIRKKQQGGFYDLFRKRLIFPIYSIAGEVIGFGGRSYDDQDKPKYINSVESPIFNKSNTFYGINLTAKFIKLNSRALVVEGYMDFIALYKSGINNCVATLGTALTDQHARLLKRYTQDVVLMFDGDKAGLAAAEKSFITLVKENIIPYIVELPEGMDPDNFIKSNGADSLKSLVSSAKEMFFYLLDKKLKDVTLGPSIKFKIVDSFKESLRSMSNKSLRELYCNELAKRLNVTYQWVVKTLTSSSGSHQSGPSKYEKNKYPSQKSSPSVPNLNKKSESFKDDTKKWSLKGGTKDELLAFSLCLKSLKLFNIYMEEALPYQPLEQLKDLCQFLLEKHRQKPEEFGKLGALVVSHLETPKLAQYYLDLVPGKISEQEEEKLMRDCIKKIKSRYLKGQAQILAGELKKVENGNNSDSDKIVEQIVNIHKSRLSIKN